VLPKLDIRDATKRILQPRPDLLEFVLSILGERFPHFNREEIMALINLPTDHLRDTRFGQELLAEGEARGEARDRSAEAVAVALRQLSLVCGPMSEATTSRIQALPLAQLESLAEPLLDFSGAYDLAAWLAEHGS
jgi:predicted transposase YdaD